MLEATLETLRLQGNGGDVAAEHAIDAVCNRIHQELGKANVAPEVLLRWHAL
jgi:hypothetical protein